VLPLVAAAGPAGELPFLTVERLAGVGGLVAANGLYSLGVLLLALELRGPARWLGWGTFAGGMLLVAAGFTGVAWQAAAATVPTMALYCVWVVAVARALAAAPR
jgi:hypothetical protein